jgi:signal transduction histidine kinase
MSVINDLRPPDLDGKGLPAALRRLVARMSGTRLAVTAEVPDHPLDLSPATELTAYRIAAESLTNVLQHAAAQLVTVRLDVDDDHLLLEVADDGVGPVAAPPRGEAGTGTGISSMRQRARDIGGSLTVLPRPGGARGTLVRAVLPLGPR